MTSQQTKAAQSYAQLRSGARSLTLATVDASGLPAASYAPCVFDETSVAFYVLLSTLAEHTANLQHSPHASILVLREDQATRQPFARERISYDCDATPVARHSEEWTMTLARFAQRFGEIVRVLEQLPDFMLFRLSPTRGRFVVGFGQAYALAGEKLERLLPVDAAKRV